MAFDRAMQLRCSLEERSSDLAKMDDAEIGFILDGSGGFSHRSRLLLMLRIEARRSISPAMINEDNGYISFISASMVSAQLKHSGKIRIRTLLASSAPLRCCSVVRAGQNTKNQKPIY